MSEEQFEEFVQREGGAYNAPPADVPRDEMWQAIQASRRAVAVAPISRGRTQVAWWMGLAATLVLGVGLGRYTMAGRSSASGAEGGPVRVSAADSVAGNIGFDVVADQHLARAEALLTTYRASSTARADRNAEERMSLWAQNMLSNTRLLMDSPAASDPARKKLLEDLELVLVQLVQRSPQAGAAADDRLHVERSIDRTHMIPRLRSAQQAGMTRGT